MRACNGLAKKGARSVYLFARHAGLKSRLEWLAAGVVGVCGAPRFGGPFSPRLVGCETGSQGMVVFGATTSLFSPLRSFE